MDYIVERKRMDDLVHSCTDGRLPDQKVSISHAVEVIVVVNTCISGRILDSGNNDYYGAFVL